MVIYPTFEDWFYEKENYSLRAERFFQHLDILSSTRDRNDFIENWMRAAFEAGRNPEDRYV